MENLAIDHRLMETVEQLDGGYANAEVVEFDRDFLQRDSLSENFNNEIEAWARHALAANGFGDF